MRLLDSQANFNKGMTHLNNQTVMKTSWPNTIFVIHTTHSVCLRARVCMVFPFISKSVRYGNSGTLNSNQHSRAIFVVSKKMDFLVIHGNFLWCCVCVAVSKWWATHYFPRFVFCFIFQTSFSTIPSNSHINASNYLKTNQTKKKTIWSAFVILTINFFCLFGMFWSNDFCCCYRVGLLLFLS